MTIAFGVHPLLRPGATIPTSLATIIGRVRPTGLGAPPCRPRDYRADRLLRPFRRRITVRSVVIAQLRVVIT